MAKLTKEDLLNLSRLHHEISVILLKLANKAEDEEINSDEISDYQEIDKIYSLGKSTEEVCMGIMMQESLEEKIVSILKELSIPTNVKGYRYLRDAIKLALFDRSILKHITKSYTQKLPK